MAIYVLWEVESSNMKVGYSEAPLKRYLQLQQANSHQLCIIAVFPGTREDEKAIFKKFNPNIIRGEWMFYCPELVKWAMEQSAPQPDLTFYDWLKYHRQKETPIGDLARDVMRDKNWPIENSEYHIYRNCIERFAGCEPAYNTLDEAWSLWKLSPWENHKELSTSHPW